MADLNARAMANNIPRNNVLRKNLFDKSKATPNMYVYYKSGGLQSNSSYYASDYIPVVPGQVYARTYSHQMAFYDVNKVFVGGRHDYATNPNVLSTFTPPSNAAYVRLTVANSVVDTFQVWALDPSNFVLGPVEAVVPRKIYGLVSQPINYYYKNFIKSLSPLVYIGVTHPNGKGTRMDDHYSYTPGSTADSFQITFSLKDMYLNTMYTVTTTLSIMDTTNTNPVNILAIGDSITRDGGYLKSLVSLIPNCQAVGTRQYTGENIAREGRGGWTLANYFNNIGMTTTVDSPFLFPMGVAGSKYWGNTLQWKNICYANPSGYDYDGFQRIAKGWTGSSFQFDSNGYPINPAVGDVVCDPTKPSGSQFLQWNGTTWTVMSPQPTIEFNFSKYMDRYAAAFAGAQPNVVTFLLGTNDFMNAQGIDNGITDYLSKLNQAITSIKAYNPNMKIIILLPMIGGTNAQWSAQSGTTQDFQFNRNMQELASRLLKEFDNDTQLAQSIYVCNTNMVVDPANIGDFVHPTSAGHTQMAVALAGLIQSIR